MSSKTKIIVLHMKEIIYTAIFAVLGIILILLLTFMFFPKDKKTTDSSREIYARYIHGSDYYRKY